MTIERNEITTQGRTGSGSPWDYIQDWDVELVGPEIRDPLAVGRWARAFALAGGLGYMWNELARPVSEIVYGLLELRPGGQSADHRRGCRPGRLGRRHAGHRRTFRCRRRGGDPPPGAPGCRGAVAGSQRHARLLALGLHRGDGVRELRLCGDHAVHPALRRLVRRRPRGAPGHEARPAHRVRRDGPRRSPL